MLDLIGHVAGMVSILVSTVAVLTVIPMPLRHRLYAAAGVGAWVGLAMALSASGALAFSPATSAPMVGILFATPLVTMIAFVLASPGFRATLLAIPMPVLIALNAMRTLGALFLALAVVGRLGGPFPVFAGIGDIITGLLAIPLARRVARGDATRVASWNAFGTLDLIVAITLGTLSTPGSPIQLLRAGVGSAAMQHLPFSLVPTVLVPFYLSTHAVIAAQLAARAKVRVLATA